MIRILFAFDPGPHTGYAVFRNEMLVRFGTVYAEDTPAARMEQLFELKAILDEYKGDTWNRNTAPSPPHAVIEDYRTQQALTREGALTLHLVGWLEGECLLNGILPSLVPSSARTTYLPETKPFEPQSNHERDAIAHGLAYLAKHKETADG